MSDLKIIGVVMLIHRFVAFFLIIGYCSLLTWLSCYRKNKKIAIITIFAILLGFYILSSIANRPCEEWSYGINGRQEY
jgi:hypothetical protein